MSLNLSSPGPGPRDGNPVPPETTPKPIAGLTARAIYQDHMRPSNRTDRKLRHWEKFSGDPSAETIDTDCFNHFREKAHAGGFSRNAIEHAVSCVFYLLRFAFNKGLISKLPDKGKPPKRHHRAKRNGRGLELSKGRRLPVSITDLERILAAAMRMPGDVMGIPARLFWPALVWALMDDTGLSAAELLRVKVSAYDPHTGTITQSERKIRLHPRTADAINEMLPYVHGKWLFPIDKNAVCDTWVYGQYRQILNRAGFLKCPMVCLRNAVTDAGISLDAINPDAPPPLPPRKKRTTTPPPIDNAQVFDDNSPETIREYFEEVYKPLRLANGSTRTVEKYRSVINCFSEFLGTAATFQHCTDDNLQRYQSASVGKLSPDTINTNTRHLLAIWRHGWKKRRVLELPRDVELLSVPKRNPEAWSQAELARLLKSAGEMEGDIKGIAARLFWPALVWFLYETGLRIGAALSVRSQDVDLETGTVHVRPEHQKQKQAQVFRLHPDTLNAIRAIDPQGRDLVFNYPYSGKSKRYLFQLFGELLERAGLPSGRKDKFHRLRRTTATAIAESLNDEAARLHLGHSHQSVTNRYIDRTQVTPRVNVSDAIARPKWTVEQ